MRSKNLWQGLSNQRTLAATDSKWRFMTGDDYAVVRQFLRPLQEYAESIPCRNKRECMCQHEVVELSNGEMIAVCQCEYDECDSFPVTKTDLVIYDFNERLFCQKIAEAMNLNPISRQVDDLSSVYHLSDIRTDSGLKFPVFLVIRGQHTDLDYALLLLLATYREPPIILHVSTVPLSPRCTMVIQHTGALVISLADAVPVVNGKFMKSNMYVQSLDRFLAKNAPSKESGASVFPTPPGTTWGNVHIHFKYTDQVTITAKDKTREFTCHELGMGNKRKKKPTVLWDFFYEIAGNNGMIDYLVGNKDKNKDWKTQLSKHLRRIFGIEDDPFLYDEEDKIWQAKFKVSC